MARLVRNGLLTRTGRGTFVLTEHLEQLSVWPAFALRSRAFLAACGSNAVATGASAAAIWGLPMLGRPPQRPTAARVAGSDRCGSGTSSPYGLIHATSVPASYVTERHGTRTADRCWAAVDVARRSTRVGLVAADAVVRGGVDRTEMADIVRHMRRWPGAVRARWVTKRADGRSESPLESLGRHGLLVAGVPLPLSNVWVGPGYPLYRVDHLWPDHGVVAEADGGLKYRGSDPADVVTAEKEREQYLRRELGLDVWPYDWELALRRPARLATLARQVLASNPMRETPVQWWRERHGT